MSQDGHSSGVIAEHLHLQARTVREIIQKFRETDHVNVKQRSGRPRKIDARFDRRLKFLSLRHSDSDSDTLFHL